MLFRSKAGEALELALPHEPAARKIFTGVNARRLADFLMPLGRARLGVGFNHERFMLAEANLLEAYAIYVAARDRGPAHTVTLSCVRAIVDLYTAWAKAEPAKGYANKASDWQAKLDAANAASTSPRAAP